MHPCILFLHARKRFSFFSQFASISTSCCAVHDPSSSSDDSAMPESSNYINLQQKMQIHATSGSITEAFETLDFMSENFPGKPTVYDYNSLIKYYFKSETMVVSELLELFIGMKRFGPKPNLLTYQILINGFKSVGRLNNSILITEEMIASGFWPSYTILSKLFKKVLKFGSVMDAAKVLVIMLNANFTPTQCDLSALIRRLCEYGMVQRAYSVASALSGKGCSFRGSVYNPILWALCKSESSYAALTFFGLLEKKGFARSVYQYTALVYCFSKERQWDEVFCCLDKMESDGCEPTIVTYTIIVKFLCDNGHVDDALSLLDIMEERGCTPDLVMYNIILHELCYRGRAAEFDDLVRAMDRRGLSPDVYTHSALAGGMLKRGKVEIANKFLFSIISRGCSVDDVVYNMYLQSMCYNGKSGEALSAVQCMMEKGFRPTNISYNIILKGLCKEKNMDEAMHLFDHTKAPDLISFNTVLSAACKMGDSSTVQRILQRMEREGIKYDVVSSTCLIQYYLMTGKIKDCLSLVDIMLTKGPQPNSITLNTLIAGLCKNRLLGTAVKVFNDCKRIGVSPDTTTYNILLRASIHEGTDSLVYELSRDMNIRKVKPDVGTYGCFIYHLCKQDKLSHALHLRDQMRDNGIPLNVLVYNTLMKPMFMRRMFWEIISLLKDMAIDGCEPNKYSFNMLKWAKSKSWMKGFPRAAKILELVLHGACPKD